MIFPFQVLLKCLTMILIRNKDVSYGAIVNSLFIRYCIKCQIQYFFTINNIKSRLIWYLFILEIFWSGPLLLFYLCFSLTFYCLKGWLALILWVLSILFYVLLIIYEYNLLWFDAIYMLILILNIIIICLIRKRIINHSLC